MRTLPRDLLSAVEHLPEESVLSLDGVALASFRRWVRGLSQEE